MKFMKDFKIRGLCLSGLCLMSVFALGTGSASAATALLFEGPHVHAVGLAVGESRLERTNKEVVKSSALHVLLLTLGNTLFDVHILFLGVQGSAGALSPCGLTATTTSTEHVLIELLGHLGLADPGNRHAALLLVPSGFAFFCHNPLNNTNEEVKVRGSVIGLITKPAAGVETTELGLQLKQSGGIQEFTEFLLPPLMTGQILESATGAGAFEQAGEATPEVVVKSLLTTEKFKLVLE